MGHFWNGLNKVIKEFRGIKMSELKEIALTKFRDVLALLIFETVAVIGTVALYNRSVLPLVAYFNTVFFVLALIAISFKLYLRLYAIDNREFRLQQMGSKLEIRFYHKWLNMRK